MASKSLTFDIFGRDRTASSTMHGIGATATNVARNVARAAAAIAAALAVVVVRFGIESVQAAAEAETQQAKLADAYSKFPALMDVNIQALREYNTELAKKTKYDDDAIASGQAVLANFKLTGTQIQRLTPLLLDFASKTGQDLPTAAEALGKAMLGNSRALKELGIEFTATGNVTADYNTLMDLLAEKVGGFAEKEGTTAAGKLEILKNRFGEVQEAIGVALMPALSELLDFTNESLLPVMEDFASWFSDEGIPAIRDFIGFLNQYKDLLPVAAAGVASLAVAQWGLNAALAANPIGLVVAAVAIGVAELIATFLVMQTNFNGLGSTIFGTALGIGQAVADVTTTFQNSIIGLLNGILGPLNAIRNALGLPSVAIAQSTLGSQFRNWATTQMLGYNSATGNNNTAGVVNSRVPGAGRFAEGGIVPARPGGWNAIVGEGGHPEAIIPLTDTVLSKIGSGGGEKTVNVNVYGVDGPTAVSMLTQKLRSGLVTV